MGLLPSTKSSCQFHPQVSASCSLPVLLLVIPVGYVPILSNTHHMRMHPELLKDLSSRTYLLNRTLPVRDLYHSAAMNSITGWLLVVSVAVCVRWRSIYDYFSEESISVKFPCPSWLHALPSYPQLYRCWWVQVAISCNLSEKGDHRPLALCKQGQRNAHWFVHFCSIVSLFQEPSKNRETFSTYLPIPTTAIATYVHQVTPSVSLCTQIADSGVSPEIHCIGKVDIRRD